MSCSRYGGEAQHRFCVMIASGVSLYIFCVSLSNADCFFAFWFKFFGKVWLKLFGLRTRRNKDEPIILRSDERIQSTWTREGTIFFIWKADEMLLETVSMVFSGTQPDKWDRKMDKVQEPISHKIIDATVNFLLSNKRSLKNTMKMWKHSEVVSSLR